MTDSINLLLEKLPQYMKKSTDSNTYRTMNAFAIELDKVDENSAGLVLAIQVDTATGQDLTDIGKLFRLKRTDGELDEDFRGRILSHWSGISGGGTKDSLKQVVSDATGLDLTEIGLVEGDRKVFISVPFDIDDTDGQQAIIDSTEKAKAAGIYIKFSFTHQFTTTIFTAGVSVSGGTDVL